MERLYSSQKTYVYSKSFTLKLFLTISLFVVLFHVSERKAQNLILVNRDSVSASAGELISYTIQFVISDIVASAGTEKTGPFLNLSELLPLTNSYLQLDKGMSKKSIEGYVFINQFIYR